MATGSNPFILPMPGKDLEGVLAYRDIADTQAMIDAAAKLQARGGHRRRPAGPGGGQRPDEARHAGHRGARDAHWLMERQLDDVAGKLLQKSLEERGMQFLMGAQTQALVGNAGTAAWRGGVQGRHRGARRPGGDGRGHPPQHRLAEGMRLHVNRGIVVSDTMQTTTDARIYAVGECAAHRGIAYGLVAPLFEQGKVLANHLASSASAATRAR
jgi:nitrite reductase (NADH) large subunit